MLDIRVHLSSHLLPLGFLKNHAAVTMSCSDRVQHSHEHLKVLRVNPRGEVDDLCLVAAVALFRLLLLYLVKWLGTKVALRVRLRLSSQCCGIFPNHVMFVRVELLRSGYHGLGDAKCLLE